MLTARKIARARARDLQLVSLILLTAQLLSFGHLLSAGHATCPEHGDIIHIEHAEGTSTSASASHNDAPVRPSLAAAETAMGADHDHCLVCATANRRCLVAGPAQALAACVFVTHVFHAVASASFAPIDLILLSPKNSPPSA